MIATQQIKSTTTKPVSLEKFETINVLKWNNWLLFYDRFYFYEFV